MCPFRIGANWKGMSWLKESGQFDVRLLTMTFALHDWATKQRSKDNLDYNLDSSYLA